MEDEIFARTSVALNNTPDSFDCRNTSVSIISCTLKLNELKTLTSRAGLISIPTGGN